MNSYKKFELTKIMLANMQTCLEHLLAHEEMVWHLLISGI